MGHWIDLKMHQTPRKLKNSPDFLLLSQDKSVGPLNTAVKSFEDLIVSERDRERDWLIRVTLNT